MPIDAQGTIFVADAGDTNTIRRVDARRRRLDARRRRDRLRRRLGRATRGSTARPDSRSIRRACSTSPTRGTTRSAASRLTAVSTTLAGDGRRVTQDGVGDAARFNGPIGVAVDASGRVIVADTYNDRIRAIAPDGTVTTIAGGPEPGLLDRPGLEARFDTPCGVAIDPSGNILVADTGNDVIRVITPSGEVSSRIPTIDQWLARPTGIASGGRWRDLRHRRAWPRRRRTRARRVARHCRLDARIRRRRRHGGTVSPALGGRRRRSGPSRRRRQRQCTAPARLRPPRMARCSCRLRR